MAKQSMSEIGAKDLLDALKAMLLIRNFEIRGEAAYQQGLVGGFYHSYIGQEAIQVGCIAALGTTHWFTTTYRCHALALLLGATPDELMAELYGKVTGNAKGRGGSMHLFEKRMLGGFGIVGGHVPVATGAAFSIKYLNQKGLVSVCFMGDGSVVQGAVHESLNLAVLWKLPCIYVIENNQWGMGTAVSRAVAVKDLAKHFGVSYEIPFYTVDGMDFFQCHSVFKTALQEVLTTSRPVVIEAITERFRGHSISDPGLYRSKEEVLAIQKRDPILLLKTALMDRKLITDEQFKVLDKEQREIVLKAMKFAEESPWPDPVTLEEDVFAP